MNKKWRVVYLGSLVPALVIAMGLWSPRKEAVADGSKNAPRFKVDPFWPKPLPSDVETNPAAATDGFRTSGPGATKPWVTGEVAGHGFDSKDHVFIVTRGPQGSTNPNAQGQPTTAPTNLVSPETVIAHPSPSVVEFDSSGNVVNSWPPNLPSALPPWWTAPIDPVGCDGSDSWRSMAVPPVGIRCLRRTAHPMSLADFRAKGGVPFAGYGQPSGTRRVRDLP